jgi:putative Holliday junction resolvase
MKELKNNKNRLMGIDYGERYVGMALSDLTWIIASPFKTIDLKKEKNWINLLGEIIHLENVVGLVVGRPLHMNGDESELSQKATQVAQMLTAKFEIPHVMWDERWSSQAVNRGMLEADLSRAKRDKNIDKLAAAYILQGYLDSLR